MAEEELNDNPYCIWLKDSTLKRISELVEKIHKRGLRDLHWGRSSLIREVLEKNLDSYVEKLLKE